MEKIYCMNCKFHYVDLLNEHYCEHPKTQEYVDNPIKRHTRSPLCYCENLANNCLHFTPKLWYRIKKLLNL